MELPKNNVDKLLNNKKEIEKEIEQIQSDCSHTLKSLKQTQRDIRWHCDECKQVLGYASQPDLDKFFNHN
jgi:peptidoglycan hydrolase CwlO-like protein